MRRKLRFQIALPDCASRLRFQLLESPAPILGIIVMTSGACLMPEDERTIQLSANSLLSQMSCPERYQMKSLIGQGGMGMVFRAFDQQLNRDVAIKVLLFNGASEEESQQRFIREGKALALLDHPNIVRIFSSGLNGQGNPYNVMEFLEGESLSRILERGPLNAEDFFDLFSQVLSGLRHAHEHNIVHRDLKPTNIMHCKDGGDKATYKLIDFGIARLDMSPERAARTLTRTNAVLGSPIYISPEQCRGERGDFVSDIYSLGIIMYECIEGNPPFKGDTAFETMYKHMSETSCRLDLKTKSTQSKDLASLIERCLAKDPEARPQTVAELEGELNRIFSSDKDLIDLFGRKRRNGRQKLLVPISIGISCLLLSCIIGIAILVRSNNLSSEVVKTEQDKVSGEIRRLKSRIVPLRNPAQSIKEHSLRQKYLMERYALGRAELKSPLPADLCAAENTFSEALSFCQALPAVFSSQRATCLAYRAKARFMQAKLVAADSDYEQAIKLADKEAVPDILLERCALRLRSQDLDGATRDFIAVRDDFVRQGGLHNFSFFFPKLDKNGELRCMLFNNICYALCKLKPQSEAEAVKMVSFSNELAPLMMQIQHKIEAKQSMDFALSLLNKIGSNEDLKKKTRAIAKAVSD